MFHVEKYSKTLKPLFERDWNLYNIILSQYNFESDCPEAKFQTITAQSQSENVTPRGALRKSGQLFSMK